MEKIPWLRNESTASRLTAWSPAHTRDCPRLGKVPSPRARPATDAGVRKKPINCCKRDGTSKVSSLIETVHIHEELRESFATFGQPFGRNHKDRVVRVEVESRCMYTVSITRSAGTFGYIVIGHACITRAAFSLRGLRVEKRALSQQTAST